MSLKYVPRFPPHKVCNYCHCQKKLQKVPEESFQPRELIKHQVAKFEAFSFSIRNAATALFLMSFVREKGGEEVEIGLEVEAFLLCP